MIHRGEIPDGLFVLHRCDNRLCANPEHLFLGTAGDNNRDMWAKGRAAKLRAAWPGSMNGSSRFIEADIPLIRLLIGNGMAKPVPLAAILGVTKEAIYNIVNRKTWVHVS